MLVPVLCVQLALYCIDFFFPVYALLQKLLQSRTLQKTFLNLQTKREKIWVYRIIKNEYGYKD